MPLAFRMQTKLLSLEFCALHKLSSACPPLPQAGTQNSGPLNHLPSLQKKPSPLGHLSPLAEHPLILQKYVDCLCWRYFGAGHT